MTDRATRNRGLAIVATLGLAFTAVGTAQAGKGRPDKAKENLTAPEDGPLEDARGKLLVKHFPGVGHRPERSWIRVRAKKLLKKADYTIWVDDPATEVEDYTEWESFTTRGNGNLNLRLDTKKGGGMPFDASLDDLQGTGIQIRDGDDAVVLEGVFPSFPVEEPPPEEEM